MERYQRQIALSEIGRDGQEKLAQARVLVVGVGGLGSPVSLYLAAAGVGSLGLIDDDVVSISNLQRQILYTESEVGQAKVTLAAQKLSALNSSIHIEAMQGRLSRDTAEEIIGQYDIVVDGTDNYETRVIIDETCVKLNKIYVYGAIEGFVGQVSVFSPATIRYADLYEAPTKQVPPPVIGMTPGIVGSVLAHEVVKIICDYGDVLYNTLWTIDLRTMQTNLIAL